MRTMLLALAFATGCSTVSPAPARVPSGGTRIYVGNVFGTEGTAMFRYTRDSRVQGDTWTSVHTSRSVPDGQLVVAQAAEHDASYRLHRYVEDHEQLGIRSEVIAEGTDSLAYTRHKGGRVRRRTEHLRAPAVTGPTLFGFVATHWDRLHSGEKVPVQFVVAERGRSYAFTLEMTEPGSEFTVVAMRASRPLLRLSIPTMQMTFHTATRAIVRYEGRIPPRWEGRAVDARVEYEHIAPYR